MRGLLSLLKPLCFWIVNGCAFLLKEAHWKCSQPHYSSKSRGWATLRLFQGQITEALPAEDGQTSQRLG